MIHIRLRSLRKDRGFTQKQIAGLLLISTRTYSSYETGAARIPIDVLVKLARILNVNIDYLLGLTDMETPYPKKKK